MGRGLARRFGFDDLAQKSAFVLALTLSAGLLNYAYQLVMSGLLTPLDYGVLISLLSLFSIFSVVASSVQVSVTRFAASVSAQQGVGEVRPLWRFALRRATMLGLLVGAVMALAAWPLAAFLHFDTPWLIGLVAIAFIPAFAMRSNLGVIIGLQRFVVFGASESLVAVLRLAVGGLLVLVGLKVAGALVAVPIALVAGLVVTSWYIGNVTRGNGGAAVTPRGFYDYGVMAMLTMMGLSALSNLDVILAKHYLSPQLAGDYAAMAVLGKSVLFATMAIALVLFPKASAIRASGQNPSPLLRRALAYATLIGAVGAVGLLILAGFINDVLLDGRYPLVGEYLPAYGLGMALLGVALTYANYLLAIGRTRVAFAVGLSVVIQLTVFVFLHDDIGELVVSVVIASISAVVIVSAAHARFLRSPASAGVLASEPGVAGEDERGEA